MANPTGVFLPHSQSLASHLALSIDPAGATYADIWTREGSANSPVLTAAADHADHTKENRDAVDDMYKYVWNALRGDQAIGSFDIGGDLTLAGDVLSSLTATSTAIDIGDATTKRWGTLYATDLNLTGQIVSAADRKDSVRFATAATLPAATLVGNVLTADANGAFPTVDGVTAAATDRMLNKDYGASDLRHGLYVVTDLGSAGTPWILTRSDDADTDAKVTGGLTVPVNEGTANADTMWQLRTNDPITLNTTALEFGFGGVTAHASLTGLGADDHTLYFLADGTRDITGNVFLNSPSPLLTVGDGTATFANIRINSLGNAQFQFHQAGTAEALFQVGSPGDLTIGVDASGSLKTTLYRKTTGNWEMPAALSVVGPLLLAGAVAADGVANRSNMVIGAGTSEVGLTFFGSATAVSSGVAWTSSSGNPQASFDYDYANDRMFWRLTTGTGRMALQANRLSPGSDGVQALGRTNDAGWAALALKERADHFGTPTATRGEVWLLNTATQSLMFTDDAGADWQIGGDTQTVNTLLVAGAAAGDAATTADDFVVGAGAASDIGMTFYAGAGQAVRWVVADTVGGADANFRWSGAAFDNLTLRLGNADRFLFTTTTLVPVAAGKSLGGTAAANRWGLGYINTLFNAETGTPPTTVAGDGAWWTQNDAPTSGMFTDDDGKDRNVSRMVPITLSAQEAMLPASGGPTPGTINDMDYLEYTNAGGASQFSEWQVSMPWTYGGQGITVRVYWHFPTDVPATSVVWQAAFERHVSGLDVATSSFAAAQVAVVDPAATTNAIVVTDITFTAAQVDGVVAGDSFRLRVYRDPAHGSDNFTNSVRLVKAILLET